MIVRLIAEIPVELKKELYNYAVDHDTRMKDIVVLALKAYFRDDNETRENEANETALFEGREKDDN